MQKHNLTPENSLLNEQRKDKLKITQLKNICVFLQNNVATASMVTDATGVSQKNICRYKRDLEKSGRLWEIEKATCKKTGFKAWYLTTDESIVPKSNQLKLF